MGIISGAIKLGIIGGLEYAYYKFGTPYTKQLDIDLIVNYLHFKPSTALYYVIGVSSFYLTFIRDPIKIKVKKNEKKMEELENELNQLKKGKPVLDNIESKVYDNTPKLEFPSAPVSAITNVTSQSNPIEQKVVPSYNYNDYNLTDLILQDWKNRKNSDED